ncbi:MAG: Zn-dependent exopeptidase M28 [Candidatus Hydrogenedens sp.]|nr:Zn-dependent exopeptidase M28 [Candidatus Hydrogenedens sp.]
MLNESQSEACASWVMEQVRHVIETFGPRAPGTAAERDAQKYIRDEMQDFCDGEVVLEPFTLASQAFFAMPAVTALIMLLSVVCWYVHPWISVGLDLLALAVLYFQFLRYRLFLDPLFPKSESSNVYGRIAPSGEIRRRVILAGHVDSAREWLFLYLLPCFFWVMVIAFFVGLTLLMLIHLGSAVAWAVGGSLWEKVSRVAVFQWILCPLPYAGIFFSNLRRAVPGANDNLSGVFTSMAIGRALKKEGLSLAHTELVLVSMGSEEAGLRGAKVFAEKHKEAFSDVQTLFIGMETFRDLEHMTIYDRDMNGTVHHDEQVCCLLKEAGKVRGLDLPFGSLFFGSSDAAAFTQAGWQAGLLAAMDPAPPPYYHTRLDNWDNMSQECLQQAIQIASTALRLFDKQTEEV